MNILTFDIEEWWGYEHYCIGNEKEYLPRLEYYFDFILDKLDEKGFYATFFCLGEVAKKYPEVIRKIAERGHHIGSHSYSHKFLGNTNPEEFAEDTYKSLDVIENITGEKVTAFRAPAFSITENNRWCLEILAENGILYDSSIFPAKRSFGGYSSFKQREPSIIEYRDKVIKEFPISITSIYGKDIAYSGGGYFRLFPYWKFKSVAKKSSYLMTYFHISDFDKDQVRKFGTLRGESSIIRYFKSYYGLNGCFSKFQRLISDFDFINIKQADECVDWENASKVVL